METTTAASSARLPTFFFMFPVAFSPDSHLISGFSDSLQDSELMSWIERKSLSDPCLSPSSETRRSNFSVTRSDMTWRNPCCSFSTFISLHLRLLPMWKTHNTASNPLRWLTAQQALYRMMGLTFYRPTVDRYQPRGGRSMSEGPSLNQDWNAASVRHHIERRRTVGLCSTRQTFLSLVEECVSGPLAVKVLCKRLLTLHHLITPMRVKLIRTGPKI